MIAPTPISVEFSDSKVTTIGCEFADGNATAIDCLFADDNATAISVEFGAKYIRRKKRKYLGDGYVGNIFANERL